MLAPSGTPVVRRYFDEAGKQIDLSDLERGYELDDHQFVVVTDEELEALAPEQSRDIDLSRFVPREAIPPLFFERAYILAPAGNSNTAYRLLASTLERTNRAGLASFVMRGKQYTVAIVAERGLLRAETLRFAEELRTPEDIGLPELSEPSAQKVKAMRSAIDKATRSTVAERELSDSYWQRLEALVEKKYKRQEDLVKPEPSEEPEEHLAEVIDLVAVLRKSLGQADTTSPETPKTAPSKAAPSKAAPSQTRPSKAGASKPRAPRAKKTTARKASASKATPKKTAKRSATKRPAAKRAAHGR
jgi:DNA end-binding protein Ku